MKVITRRFKDTKRGDTFTIVPIGDVHIGAAACDENRLKRVVERIKEDDKCYWIGIGDYCDFINKSDPRFSPGALAKWFKVPDLIDITAAQRDHFLEIIKPIASKCLAMLEGNHETAITRHYERHIFSELVTAVKQFGGFADDYKLSLGYNGWLKLQFDRSRGARKVIKLYLHHGHGGGKLAGAKALNMQKVLWTHDADLVLFGHTHNTMIQAEAIETISGKKVFHVPRIGAFCGSFLGSFNQNGGATYSEIKGYHPMPMTGIEVILRPGADKASDRIKVVLQ